MSDQAHRKATTYELTDAMIHGATCPQGKAETYLRDSKVEGLAVRLRPTGGKTWIYFYSIPGVRGMKRYTIGAFSRSKGRGEKLDVKAARTAAKIRAGEVAAGKDPNAAKREEKEARATAAKVITLGQLIKPPEEGKEEHCPYAVHRIQRQKTYRTPLSALRRNLLPVHKNTDIKKLTRRDITSAIEPLLAANKVGAARDLWKHSYTFLSWCVRVGHITTGHPLAGVSYDEKESRAERLDREEVGRILTDEEIIKVWKACGKFGAFGLLVRMCLLSGARRSEPTLIEWNRYVMDDRITFDARWTKMGRHHDVPRTQLMNEVLEDAERFRRAGTDLVFPGRLGTPISGFTTLLGKLIKEAGVEKFTMHDLRRTIRSVMNRCGYDDQEQRAAIGQKAPAFDAKYNKDPVGHWFIRRCAFDAAHDYIAALIGGKRIDNVISFHRANNPRDKLDREKEDRLRAYRAEAGT